MQIRERGLIVTLDFAHFPVSSISSSMYPSYCPNAHAFVDPDTHSPKQNKTICIRTGIVLETAKD